MRKLAILHGMFNLALVIFKSIFKRGVLIYKCPNCGLVLRKSNKSCMRCGILIDWSGF